MSSPAIGHCAKAALSLVILFIGIEGSTGDDLELLGRWPGFRRGSVNAIAVQGTYAYCTGPGFQVCDLSKPERPERVASLDLIGEGYGVVVRDSYAYVANGAAGLAVIDISQPAVPRLVGSTAAVYGNSVAVQGNYAFVADEYRALKIFEISDPALPRLVANYPTSQSAVGVTVSGQYGYVAIFQGPILILDISDPAHPKAVASAKVTGEPWRVAIADDYAYVTGFSTGLQIIDISTPSLPRTVSHLSFTGWSRGVTVQNGFAFVVTYPWDSGPNVRVIDVRDPKHPRLIGSSRVNGAAIGLTLSGQQAWVAGEAGVDIVDISDPAHPQAIGNLDLNGQTQALAVSGSFAYLADGIAGLQVIDISDAAKPRRVGRWSAASWAMDVAVTNGLACVAAGEQGLQLLDVANPSQPRPISSLRMPSGHANAVAFAGKHLCVLDGNLQVIDVTDPAKPALLSSYSAHDTASSLAANGYVVFLAEGERGWEAVDLSNPAKPARMTWQTNGMTASLALAGFQLYVPEAELKIWDVSNPSRPALSGRYQTSGFPGRMATDGNNAFLSEVTEFWRDLLFLDVSNPARPTLVTAFNKTRDWQDPAPLQMLIHEGLLLSAQADAGMSLRRLPASLTVFRPVSDQRVLFGDPVELSIGAAGGAPVQFTWYAGHTGDTSAPIARGPALTVPPLWDPATYWVRLTNSSGTIDSPPVNVRPVQGLQLIPRGSFKGPAQAIALGENLACLAAGSVLEGLDLSDPTAPRKVGQISLQGYISQVALAAGYAFAITDNSAVQVVDFRVPSRPVVLGTYTNAGAVFSRIAAGAARAYVIAADGLLGLDFSDPTEPKPMGTFNPPTQVNDIAVNGTYLLALRDTGLVIVDFSAPGNPVEIGSYSECADSWCPPAVRVMAQGSRAIVSYPGRWFDAEPAHLAVIDLTIPAHPKRVASLPTNGGLIGLSVNFAVLLDPENTLEIVDLRDPATPVRVARLPFPGSFLEASVSGDQLWLVDSQNALEGFELTPMLRVGLTTGHNNSVLVRWTGGPGIALQMKTNLSEPVWNDVDGTEGLNQFRVSASSRAGFFRAIRRRSSQ